MINTYLSFAISSELYAINVTNVLEVLQKQNITQIPNTPDFISGIINFRGEVIPVFDSRIKFKLSPRHENESFVIIVLDLSTQADIFRIGAIVDKVKDVINIDQAEVKPVPTMSQDFDSEFIDGIFKQDQNFVMLLNAHKVFSDSEINSLKTSNPIE